MITFTGDNYNPGSKSMIGVDSDLLSYSPQSFFTLLLFFCPDCREAEEEAESECSDHVSSEERERLRVGRLGENFIQNIQGYSHTMQCQPELRQDALLPQIILITSSSSPCF